MRALSWRHSGTVSTIEPTSYKCARCASDSDLVPHSDRICAFLDPNQGRVRAAAECMSFLNRMRDSLA